MDLDFGQSYLRGLLALRFQSDGKGNPWVRRGADAWASCLGTGAVALHLPGLKL